MTTKKRRMQAARAGRLVVGSLSFASGLMHAQVTNALASHPVKVESGMISGTKGRAGIKEYLGIPFAAPRVRENRWRAPQPVAHWISGQ